MKIWQKTISVVATFALLFNSLAAPLTVLAQTDPTSTPTDSTTLTASPSVQPTTTPDATPAETASPTPEITPAATDLVTPIPSETPTPTAIPTVTATPTAAPEPTPTSSPWTFEKVELNKKYQSGGVTLTFTKLPSPAGNIKIEEITLTAEQIKQTGSLSDKAYDITSDMADGSFTYNLSLPIPEASKGKAVDVKFAEELSNIGSAAKVENTLTKTDTSVSITSLDHFTIFIVYSQTVNKWGSYTSQHNTSVAGSTYFPSGDTATVYDNFTLGANASITNVQWKGVYYDGPLQPLCTGIAGSPCPANIEGSTPPAGAYGYGPAAAGTISGFTIKFYSDIIDSGLHKPDIGSGPIHTTIISGNAGQTDTGITDLETVYYGPNEIYSYTAALATPFAATNGTQYWMSIVADSSFAPEWGWATAGTRSVGDSYRQDTSGGTLIKNISGGDFTFSLSSDFVLTLTAPAATTITRSVLVPETSGVPTAGNTAVDTAVVGLSPIAVTLANTGAGPSTNVRISPIGADSHIQLWAKDTSGNWFDINVTGWIGPAGKSIPAGSSITTDVYAISDVAGSYPLTVNLVYIAGGAAATATGTVTVTPIIYTIYSQTDFAAFDGVGITPIGTNFYTVSPGITATYINGTGTVGDPVNFKLTGYAPLVTSWFWPGAAYNWVTIGIKLPTGFTRTRVYQAGVMRYDDLTHYPDGYYSMGTGSTDLATTGGALGYLDFSFAANSNNTKKDGLVKLQVIWTEGGTPEYFTIDINDLSLIPDTTPNAFSFTDQTNVALSTAIESNTITVAGINVSADVSVVGGEYSVNGGAYTSISGAVSVGATVKVRHTSSASNSTAVNTTLTIGGVSDTFTSTTLALPAPHLKLMVAVINDNGGSAPTTAWSPMAVSSLWATLNSPPIVVGQVEGDVTAGTYTLSEIANPAPGPAGYTASAWSCTNGISVNGSSQITLGLGQTTICTITNNDSDIFPPTTTDDADGLWHNSDFQVHLTCDGTGSAIDVIYWTTNGTDPTASNYNGTGNQIFITNDGTYTVKYICKDLAGNTESVKSTAVNAVKLDKTAPTGGSIGYADGYYTSTSVGLTTGDGDGSVAGIDTSTRTIQRQDATLTNNVCGGFGSWNTITPTGSYPSFTDTTVTDGNCYQYKYLVTDNASNTATYASSNVAKIDTVKPTDPVATPAAADYTSAGVDVSLLSSDANGYTIYYTTDGTTPNGSSSTTTPITVNKDTTIKAVAIDPAGNASNILTAVYGIPPVISGETEAAIGDTTATITWTTDDLSTSRVIYDTVSHLVLGAAPNYGYASSTVEDGTKVTSHSVGLTGLSSGTTYYYRTVSHGSPETVSAEQTFATTSTPSGGSGVSDGLGCANHDCSTHPQGQVLGISTSVSSTSWPKLAYAYGANDNNVLGADTEVTGTPSASPSPVASPEVINEPVNTNPGFMKWILTHKKISGGIALILLAVAYGLYRFSKKNK